MAKPSQPNHFPENIASLTCEIEDAIGSAQAFGKALELMSLGLRELKDDHSTALMTVTEEVLRHLNAARRTCRLILNEVRGPAKKKSRASS